MPQSRKVGKQRTSAVAKKRVKRTAGGKGKLIIDKPAHNHLLLQKSKGQKAKAKNPVILSKTEAKKLAKLHI